jgi:hypothetical protein
LALANPAFADSKTDSTVWKAAKAADNAKDIYDCVSNPTIEQCAETAAKAAIAASIEVAAVPTAVTIASATGVTASTGTAIAGLSGAAATSSTLAAIGGSSLVAPVTAALGITAAPAAVGFVVVSAVGYGVYEGVTWLFFDD